MNRVELRKKKIVYISWTDFNWHAALLAQSLNIKLFFIKKIRRRPYLPKIIFISIDYIIKSLKTLFIIIKGKYNFIIFENPPPVSSVIGLILVRISKKNLSYGIDAHNGAFEKPFINFPFVLKAFRNAKFIIVHNDPLREFLEGSKNFLNCKFFTLNDPFPNIPNLSDNNIVKNYFLIVTTFHNDEPIDIALQGIANFLKKNPDIPIEFKITGNYLKNKLVYEIYKDFKGIKFLGFIDQKEFYNALNNSIGVISFSTRDNVQQFALMEALGANKPFISNNNKTNIDLFDNKMILTPISPEQISNSIHEFLIRKEELLKNIQPLKEFLIIRRQKDLDNLKQFLNI